MPQGKAPGPDCFTSKYYKSFVEELTPHLGAVFLQAQSSGTFDQDMLEATVVTIPKPGKSMEACANYRPISLINLDVKIYSKIMAIRLAEILPFLICNDQVGFIHHRQGPDNTKKLLSLTHLMSTSQIPGVILSLDAEKAFDRVHWLFLQMVLRKFGVPEEACKAFFALYNLPTAKVLTAGFLSRSFTILNGTRQGCPLSPLLYALALEPLAQAIRQSDEVVGVPVGPRMHKISLFADDIMLTISSPLTSLPALHSLLQDYSAVSYHKINVPKTQTLPIHLIDEDLLKLKITYRYQWCSKSITYLD
uniref:Reverse transcriptase domain-containing protein n=1 Tax=Leptobrachium leishanense TaxID=445787 RepID=A0A8C5LYZ4_9ANUR